MFYSHEILTSPEHGVATVWLAATLGPKSTTRKINRKAIFDVNVSGACSVIVDPEIPMALRLQGSMLYGVTRVYHQQCGYTLLDAQSMRDKMISMLKLMPGGGLDPNAGKVKPSSLILPYDPSFLPETGLPGLNLDLSIFGLADKNFKQGPSSWDKTAPSNSTFAQGNNVQIELPLEEITGPVVVGFEDDIPGTAAPRGLFGNSLPGRNDLEEGILLQPDFEFDENGNIIEFHSSRLSPRKRRKITSMPRLSSDTPGSSHRRDQAINLNQEEILQDEVMMDLNNEIAQTTTAFQSENPVNARPDQYGTTLDSTEIFRASTRKRPVREMMPDETTTLQMSDLGIMNAEYLENMAQASRQKAHNKLPTLAKKKAEFCVYGQGLASVGTGLGANRETHPLSMFSGGNLYKLITGEELSSALDKNGQGADDKQERARAVTRAARARERDQIPDVEIARHAPSSIIDDASSQMPWNISASLHSSGQRQRFGSMSRSIGDPRLESSSRVGIGVGRSRITSSSPLASRSHFDPLAFDARISGGYLDDEMDITKYLEDELASDRENMSMLSDPRRKWKSPSASVSADQLQMQMELQLQQNRMHLRKTKRALASLDQETLNFYEFVRENLLPSEDGEEDGSGESVAFRDILPLEGTSRAIATQAFMNVLMLATEGWVVVGQDRLGDIYLRVVEDDF